MQRDKHTVMTDFVLRNVPTLKIPEWIKVSSKRRQLHRLIYWTVSHAIKSYDVMFTQRDVEASYSYMVLYFIRAGYDLVRICLILKFYAFLRSKAQHYNWIMRGLYRNGSL